MRLWGGRANLRTVSAHANRLVVELADGQRIDEAALLALGVLWLVVVPICLLLTILTPNKTLKPIQD